MREENRKILSPPLLFLTDSIGDAQGFSGKTPIIPSRSFSVEILTGVTLS